jgi:uncharacterized membrane protein (DUF106 family)
MFEFFAMLLNSIFWPLTTLPPVLAIFLFALFITSLIILINRILINRTAVNDLREKMNVLREQLIELQKQGNLEKAKEIVDEITKNNLAYLKHNLKALLISIVIIILVLPWVQYTYKDLPVAKIPLVLPFVGSKLNWFVWYFIASLAISWVIRKMLGWD